MQYVKRDKLTEQLAEKLVARLAASAGEGALQSRNVAYCLGQLRVREKTLKTQVHSTNPSSITNTYVY